jgi:hypothetical protein
MLGVWLWWRPVFWQPHARWAAWRSGLALQVRLYPLVGALLAVAAFYEAVEVIYILSRVQGV